MAEQGTLITPQPTSLQTWATSGDGKASGNGGTVHLGGRDTISNYEILTQSASAQAGEVQIQGFGDLVLENLQILTSQTVEIPNPSDPNRNDPEKRDPVKYPPIRVQVGQTGQSGNVNITGTGALTVQSSTLQSSTQSSSPAGNVTLHSAGLLTLQNTTQLTSNTNDLGSAGTFTLSSDTGILITGNDTLLSATTAALGPAGTLTLTAPTLTLDQGATLQTSTASPGNAGNITLNTGTFNLLNGAQIFSESTGSGNSGQINITATEAVNLGQGVQDASPVISVETSNAGRAGDITLNAPRFTLSETARITATATATATNTEGGGSISINANEMNLAGIVGIFAETQGQAPAGTLSLQPYQNNPDLIATFFDGSTISASTSGSGNGGDFRITAPQSISLSGAGTLAVETRSSGNAGNITISTQDLTLTDGVKVSASTYSPAANAGRAGDITLTATNFSLSTGASISTNTEGSGDAGNIKVNATGTIDLNNGSIEATTGANSSGNGGNIDIDPTTTTLRNGGRIAVDSQGLGSGGNINLVSGSLTLDNGSISAITRSSDGGNITIILSDLFRLGNSSFVSTEAGTAGSGGNGGDINILARFLFGASGSNSDIIANAFEGSGGNINITAAGIFGFTVGNTDTPRTDMTNNITASSRFGTSGTIETPNVDPSQGLSSLGANLVDPSSLIDRRCTLQSQANRSSFTLAGRGGIPKTPTDPLNLSQMVNDLRLSPEMGELSAADFSDRPLTPPPLFPGATIATALPCGS